MMKVLCFGDVVGKPGRDALLHFLPAIKSDYKPDLVIINAENAAGGLGITESIAEEIKKYGADVLTLGDHTFQKKEARPFLSNNPAWCIRPYNYPPGAPGLGATTVALPSGIKVGVFNMMGRIFFNSPLDCPFRSADHILSTTLKDCVVKICDLHAEATSEKIAMGRYLDGRISLLFGTHTHVQTADECILPGGTAYITDLGMSGCAQGVIGMKAEVALTRFLSGLPHAYEVHEGPGELRGIFCEIDEKTGKALRIERLHRKGNS